MRDHKRTRILHLLTSLSLGGAETNLLTLMHYFDHGRFEHAVGFGGHDGMLEAEFSRIGAQLVRVSPNPLSLKGLLALPALLQPIRSFAPDIIHSHLDLPNVLGLAAKFATGAKLLLHLHGQGIVPRRAFPVGRSYSQDLWRLAARLYRYCDKAIAICAYQQPFLTQLGLRADKVVLIPNGIDTGNYSLTSIAGGDQFRFVMIGRFFTGKGHELLIRAFAEVSAKIPGASLTLVGDGPLRSTVEAQAAEFGLGNKVEFLGLRRDIPAILAASHCLVLASLWELHPITILEAMRAGLPVIASAVGGVQNTVVDGQTGLLIRPGDLGQLVDAMLRLARNPAVGQAMGAAGHIRIGKHYSAADIATRVESVYDELTGTTD